MLQYFVESWVWSIGGLVIGFWLGRTEREVRQIMKKVEAQDDDS